MSAVVTYSLEPAQDEAVQAALAARFRTRAETPPRRLVWYDTFDWRLHRDGGTLVTFADRGATALEWRRLDGTLRRRARLRGKPAFAEDLPPGPLRDALAPVIEMRRLLPLAEVDPHGPRLRLLDGEGKTVARAVFAGGTAAPPGTAGSPDGPRPLPPRLRVTAVKGYDEAFAELTRFLDGDLGLRRRDEDELTAVLAACDRRPREYSSKLDLDLDPDLPAGEAARAVHRRLLATLLANEEGTRRDLDSEFLHDFRVSVRRTRAALGQIKGVLPATPLERFRRGFAWLGRLTGPTRDLDVYLLKFDRYRDALPAPERGDLEPLRDFLRRHQKIEQRRLAAALGTRRYRTLIADWQAFLDPETAAGENGGTALSNAGRPVTEVASERIWKMWRRVRRRGAAIGPETPAEALHRLRIDGKKLRYLLEFFRRLYPPRQIGRLIRALKKLQDNLGDFNDYEVQQRQLAGFAEQMAREDRAPVPALLAMGRLLELLAVGQQRERDRFAARFTAFAAAPNRRLFRRLFRPGGERS